MKDKELIEINRLRTKMVQRAISKDNNLLNKEVQQISQQLDKKIIKFMFKN